MLQLVNRLRYHATIFLDYMQRDSAIKTVRLTGCMHLKGYHPFLPRNAAMDATRCMHGYFCVNSPGGTILPPCILIGSPTF